MIALVGALSESTLEAEESLTTAGYLIAYGRDWEGLSLKNRGLVVGCVCVCPELTPDEQHALDRLRVGAAALPLVLVTSGAAENLRMTAPLRVDDLVFLKDLRQDLIPAVDEVVRVRSVVERFGRALGELGPRHDLRFLTCLIDVCSLAPPVPTVRGLATMASMCEQHLCRKAALVFSNRPRAPSRFLTWLRILCAYDLARRGMKPSRVAEALEIHERTLHREIRRFLGTSPTDLSKHAARHVLRRALVDLRLPPVPFR